MKEIKHLQIFTGFIMFLCLLSTGCSHLEQKTNENKSENVFDQENDYEKRIITLEENVILITKNVDSIKTKSNDLAKELSEIKEKADQSNLQEELSKTNNSIQEIKRQLALLETDKDGIKTKLEDMESLYDKSFNMINKIEDLTASMKETDYANLQEEQLGTKNSIQEIKIKLEGLESLYDKSFNMINRIEDLTASMKETDYGRLQEELLGTKNSIQEIKTKLEGLESLYGKSFNMINKIEGLTTSIKETQKKENSSHTLSDKAIELYSEGNFEDAISYWEETLKLDPANLEAKFNIEIAKDRIKTKEIQEELKALRLQKGRIK